VVVNAVGDVVDPWSGRLLAGPRDTERGRGFLSTIELIIGGRMAGSKVISENTTLGVVATNAALSKEQANKVAQMAQDGVARCIRPSHTMHDGDVMFALSLGDKRADVTVVGALAAEVIAEAIVRAVEKAETLGGIPAARDVR
jgi:L-aminopeptidase/D-esterase-like protein